MTRHSIQAYNIVLYYIVHYKHQIHPFQSYSLLFLSKVHPLFRVLLIAGIFF